MEDLKKILANLAIDNQCITILLQKMNDGIITESEYQQLQECLIRHYILQDILVSTGCIKEGDNYYYNYPICHTKISGDKLLLIADTHIGFDNANIDLVNKAFDFAVKNGIKTVIHAGDFVEGTSRRHKVLNELSFLDRFKKLQDELLYALSLLRKELNFKMLLGNHDYSTLKSCHTLINQMFKTENLEMLGMGRVIAKWNDHLNLEIGHEIKAGMPQDTLNDSIKINGHTHKYQVNLPSKTIWLPTLSSDFRKKAIDLSAWGMTFAERFWPAFVIVEMVDTDKALFREFINYDNKELRNGEEVLYDASRKEMRLVRKHQ